MPSLRSDRPPTTYLGHYYGPITKRVEKLAPRSYSPIFFLIEQITGQEQGEILSLTGRGHRNNSLGSVSDPGGVPSLSAGTTG